MTLQTTFGRDDLAHIDPGVVTAAAAVRAALQDLVREHVGRVQEGAFLPDPLDNLRYRAAGDYWFDPSEQRGSGDGAAATPSFVLPQATWHDASPLRMLRDGLGLSPFEVDVVVLCLLLEISVRYESWIGTWSDDPTYKRPTVELALILFAPEGMASLPYLYAFASEARLRTWQLIHLPPGTHSPHSMARQPLQLDHSLLWFLLGHDSLDPALLPVAALRPPDPAALGPLPPAFATFLSDLAASGPAAVALVYGPDPAALAGAALTAAHSCGRSLLQIDARALADLPADEALDLLARALRHAVLTRALPALVDAPALLAPSQPLADPVRRLLAALPSHTPVLLLAPGPEGEVGTLDPAAAFTPIPVPAPDPTAALAAWTRAAQVHRIPAAPAALRALAEAAPLAPPQIARVAQAAAQAARAEGRAPQQGHLQAAARAVLRSLAPALDLNQPRYGWDDLILPADRLALLRHLCSRVRFRSQVRAQWGLGRGTLPGVTALFAGEPGTGKTMAAEVVAADLGLDLFKVDLAQTVSKYIGETEKNLGRIFDQAEACGVVLVFDEADALFGKRSAVKDSHDRYANLETSYLLQRLERYRGLAILTTNLRANLDEAFTRRIAVSVDFPLPAKEDRLRLWEGALAQAPRDPALDLRLVAERAELAGGSILSAALAAAHYAAEEGGPIDADRLLRALKWEMQKNGRLFDPVLLAALLPPAAPPAPNGGRPERERIIYPPLEHDRRRR